MEKPRVFAAALSALAGIAGLACSSAAPQAATPGALAPDAALVPDTALAPDAALVPDTALAPDATVDSAASVSLDVNGFDRPVATIDAGLCGNGKLDPGEECDDGNTLPGDGCTSQCKLDDPCWGCGCAGELPCVNQRV